MDGVCWKRPFIVGVRPDVLSIRDNWWFRKNKKLIENQIKKKLKSLRIIRTDLNCSRVSPDEHVWTRLVRYRTKRQSNVADSSHPRRVLGIHLYLYTTDGHSFYISSDTKQTIKLIWFIHNLLLLLMRRNCTMFMFKFIKKKRIIL